jgi:predicted metalloprotease with PDZ domain
MNEPGQVRPAASYTLRFPEPSNHLVDVEARVSAPPGPGGDLELMMAVWTPGSYLVREYARHVEGLRAETADGVELAVEKTAKNRWKIDLGAGGREDVVVRYRLYCRELTVRTDFVDRELALINGAATFLAPVVHDGPAPGPYRVRLELPPEWQRAVTALDPVADPEEGSPPGFSAPDYDTLVDSPIYAGNGTLYDFEVDGVPHRVLSHGEGGPWEGEKAVSDVARIVRAQRAFWGELPYREYLFLNLIVEARGGLEHAESSVLMTSRWKMGTRKGYLEWLGLVSHELFHAWNVKRLRPAELTDIDYEREVYTRNLWVAEGITSYYDDLLVHRAGLSSRDEALEALSHHIERIQTTPGRKVQPVDLASFDAWIKHYRRDENTVNTAISYYSKGAVVAFLLDAAIRRYTEDAHSLDDALRTAWRELGPDASSPGEGSADGGFTGAQMREILEQTAGRSLEAFLGQALESTEELDYSAALKWLGLRFAEPEENPDERGEEPAGWLGIDTEVVDGRLLVRRVHRGTPAYEAGLNVDDEILAIGGFRVPPRELDERLKSFHPEQPSPLLGARRERLVELPVTFGQEPRETWKLEVDPDATAEQRAHLEAWLSGGLPPRRPAGR